MEWSESGIKGIVKLGDDVMVHHVLEAFRNCSTNTSVIIGAVNYLLLWKICLSLIGNKDGAFQGGHCRECIAPLAFKLILYGCHHSFFHPIDLLWWGSSLDFDIFESEGAIGGRLHIVGDVNLISKLIDAFPIGIIGVGIMGNNIGKIVLIDDFCRRPLIWKIIGLAECIDKPFESILICIHIFLGLAVSRYHRECHHEYADGMTHTL